VTQTDITELLAQWHDGDKQAEQRLMEALYPVIRSMAHQELHNAAFQLSLSATDLAHEAYLRLIDQRSEVQNRSHFLAITSRVMRRVLVDLLRARSADKRGGGLERVTMELSGEAGAVAAESGIDWLELEQALTSLEKRDSIAARIVEMRYFGGMSTDEVANEMQIGLSTVGRHWEFARAWLHRRL
jgi:RNA polymerase sigma factor (TIGR02999 family)